jgi:hypothetical protein
MNLIREKATSLTRWKTIKSTNIKMKKIEVRIGIVTSVDSIKEPTLIIKTSSRKVLILVMFLIEDRQINKLLKHNKEILTLTLWNSALFWKTPCTWKLTRLALSARTSWGKRSCLLVSKRTWAIIPLSVLFVRQCLFLSLVFTPSKIINTQTEPKAKLLLFYLQ